MEYVDEFLEIFKSAQVPNTIVWFFMNTIPGKFQLSCACESNTRTYSGQKMKKWCFNNMLIFLGKLFSD